MESNIAVFRGKEVRRVIHNNEWWFSVVDVCEVLTESTDAGAYWRKLKQRLKEEGSEVVTFCHGLKLTAPDGKMRETDCANTEGIFRIIQSIPSPKAEPFKRWLAKVGYERVQEIENHGLAARRRRALYQMVLICESCRSVASLVINGSSRCFAVATMILSCSSGRSFRSSIASRMG